MPWTEIAAVKLLILLMYTVYVRAYVYVPVCMYISMFKGYGCLLALGRSPAAPPIRGS